jgi:hypothetical protein
VAGAQDHVLTGDDGVGKSFVLDGQVALTQSWAGYPASPRRGGPGATPRIDIADETRMQRSADEARKAAQERPTARQESVARGGGRRV